MKNTKLYDHLSKFSLTDLKLIIEDTDDDKVISLTAREVYTKKFEVIHKLAEQPKTDKA